MSHDEALADSRSRNSKVGERARVFEQTSRLSVNCEVREVLLRPLGAELCLHLSQLHIPSATFVWL